MKSLILLALFALLAAPAFSATVLATRLDLANKKLLVDVSYAGGCKDHKFKLDLLVCMDDEFPITCNMKLVDKTKNDFCEMMVFETLSFDVTEMLNDKYFSNALLNIYGDKSLSSRVVLP